MVGPVDDPLAGFPHQKSGVAEWSGSSIGPQLPEGLIVREPGHHGGLQRVTEASSIFIFIPFKLSILFSCATKKSNL